MCQRAGCNRPNGPSGRSDFAISDFARLLFAVIWVICRFPTQLGSVWFVGPSRHDAVMAPSKRLDHDALIRILEHQLDVLTREQALAVGVTRHGLRHRLRPGGPWRRLLPGVYVAATGTPTIVQQEMAALLYAGRGSMITGLAAVRHHDVRGPVTEFVDVLMPASRRRGDAAFVRLHRTTRMPGASAQVGPLRYALLARAVADAVRGLDDLRDVRAIVADAVQRGRCQVQGSRCGARGRREHRVGPVPRGAGGRRRRDKVGRGGGPEGLAGQIRAAHATVQPDGLRR